MIRWVFNLLAAVALLLMLAAVTELVRSHYVIDRIWWTNEKEALFLIDADRGVVTIQEGHEWADLVLDAHGWQHTTIELVPGQKPPDWFVWHHEVYSYGLGGANLHVAACPLWLLVCLLGTVPLAWLIRRKVMRNGRMPGSCRHCGYDLRASPERCPECGTVKQKAST